MKILVVENKQQNKETLARLLRNNYFEVDSVSTNEEGRQYAFVNEYDLILLHENQPEETRLELCQKIRETENHTPLVILAQEADLQIKLDAFNAGVDDYLINPVSTEELIVRIRALLRRPQKIQEEKISVGPITIDLQKYTVHKNKKLVKLTRKEFILLSYLMKNEGTVLSRGKIMDHVWSFNTDPFSNTIETHILSLRKKLGDRKKPKIIQTVPGCGYKVALT